MSKQDARRQHREKERRDKLRREKHYQHGNPGGRTAAELTPETRQYYDAQDRLDSEILLSAIGMEATPQNLSQGIIYLQNSSSFSYYDGRLGECLDGLFYIANGKMPSSFPARTMPENAALQLVRDMKDILKKYELRAGELFGLGIGQKIYDTDNLEQRIRDASAERKDKILEMESKAPKTMEDSDNDPTDNYSDAVDSIVKNLAGPITKLERFRLGVPSDFYRDFLGIVPKVGFAAAMFFAKELYGHMVSKNFQSNSILMHSDGILKLTHTLRLEPESVLPDPEYFKELADVAVRLNAIDGGDFVVETIRVLHGQGHPYIAAAAKMEQLGKGQILHRSVSEMLSSVAESSGVLLELLVQHSDFVKAYEALRATGHSPAQSAEFLRDYGGYQINGSSLAAAIINLRNKPEAVKIIAENALYICCGEGSDAMIGLIKDMGRGTRALRYYAEFAVSEQPYKQLATLRYVKGKGVEGLDQFVERLREYADADMGKVLAEKDDAEFFRKVISFYQLGQEPSNPLGILRNLDLVSSYRFVPEVAQLEQTARGQIDLALGIIRGTPYEHALLGQPGLRRAFLQKMKDDPAYVMNMLKDLPNGGSPYNTLRERLIPGARQEQPAPQKHAVSNYSRIVLVSKIVHPDLLRFLGESTGIPVHVIDPAGASSKLDAIRGGDIVVYDTTHSSHSSYYTVKNLAFRRGARFRHTSHTNGALVLQAIQS